MNYQKELEFAKDLANQAGVIMLNHFLVKSQNTVLKADESPLTDADLEINKLVIQSITKQFPIHGILAEEESKQNNEDLLWVCDPIDGTFPYSHGIPTAVFSIALCNKGVPVVAVVYDPFTNRMYTSIKGCGSFLNNTQLSNLSSTLPKNQQISVDMEVWLDSRSSVIPNSSLFLGDLVNNLEKKGIWFGVLNSAVYGLMLVASGEYSAVVYAGRCSWDVAAADLIISELGGNTTDFYGNTQLYNKEVNGFVATAPYFTEDLREIIDTLLERENK